MKVTFYGTRGSLATPGRSTQRYGGNTSCVLVRGEDGSAIVLDAGTGIRAAGGELPRDLRRVDVLLTHLHMDHIQGLGFFGPLYDPGRGGAHLGTCQRDAGARSARLSAVSLATPVPGAASRPALPASPSSRPCDGPRSDHSDGGPGVCHPGPTVGYRSPRVVRCSPTSPTTSRPLGAENFPEEPGWTSGWDLARKADLLVHDAQYTREEYSSHVGWGTARCRTPLPSPPLRPSGTWCSSITIPHGTTTRSAPRPRQLSPRRDRPFGHAGGRGRLFVLPASSAGT